MNIYYNTLFLSFCVLAFLMVIDQNVVDYIFTYFRYIKITFHRFIWYTWNHPIVQLNPLTKMLMYRKYYAIAKELEKEFKNNEGKTET